MKTSKGDLVIVTRNTKVISYPHGRIARVTQVNTEGEVTRVQVAGRNDKELLIAFDLALKSNPRLSALRAEPLRKNLEKVMRTVDLDETFFPPK